MDSQKLSFLTAVLGESGAQALNKAVQRYEPLESILVPRAILSWLSLAARTGYEGEIPGVPGSYLTFSKNEADLFAGLLSVNGEVHPFDNASFMHVVAGVAVALNADVSADLSVKDSDIVNLGKQVDLLAKAEFINHFEPLQKSELEKKVLDPNAGYKITHEQFSSIGGRAGYDIKVHSSDGTQVGMATLRTTAEGDLFPEALAVHPDHRRRGVASAMYSYIEGVSGAKVRPSNSQTYAGTALWQGNEKQKQFGKAEPAPKKRKTKKIHFTKSQIERKCPDCGYSQIDQGEFTGCMCTAELAQYATFTKSATGYDFEFGKEWNEDELSLFLAIVGDGHV